MIARKSLVAVPAIAAALAMTAAPVSAAQLPAWPTTAAVDASAAWDEADTVQNNHRHYRYRRDRGIDGGDVVAGVLILGGIAAIASAVSKKDARTERYPAPYPAPPRGDYRDSYRGNDGLGNAADMCVEEIERDRRVESVDQVQRLASGWIVSGTLYDGQDFVCTIGQNGRIETIDYAGLGEVEDYSDGEDYRDDGYAYRTDPESVDRQYDEDRYLAERARLGGAPAPEYRRTDPQPAYPGGPLPGEDDQPIWNDDGND